MSVQIDVPYSGSLKCDIWVPSQSNAPAIGIVHGGGWTSGDKADTDPATAALAWANLGFAVFSINYTLQSGGAPGPTQPIADVQAFVAFFRANARKYNANPNRLCLVGESAGAQLVAMVCNLGTPGTSRPECAVLWSVPADLGGLTGSGAGAAQTYMTVPFIGNQAAWNAKSPTFTVPATMCNVRVVCSLSEDVNAGGIVQSESVNYAAAVLVAAPTLLVTTRYFVGSLHAFFSGAFGASDVNESAAWVKLAM